MLKHLSARSESRSSYMSELDDSKLDFFDESTNTLNESTFELSNIGMYYKYLICIKNS